MSHIALRKAIPLGLLLAVGLVLILGGRPARAVDVDSPPGGAITATPLPDDSPPKVIFLTFDDGPNQPWTQQMLDVLAEYNAHATFFVIGRQAILEPETIKKIYQAGNGLGNHGYNHAYLTGVSQQYFDAEVGDTGATLGDMNSMCLRPPYGAIDYNVVSFADELGYTIVKWNMDPEDWRSPGADVIAQRVISGAVPGSIVVMHDGGGDRTQTVEAVRTILKTMTAQGWQFKALCRDYPMDDITTALLQTPTPDPNATATPTYVAPTSTPWPTATPTHALTATPTATPTTTRTQVPPQSPPAGAAAGADAGTTRTPTPTATATARATTTATETAPATPRVTATPRATATPRGALAPPAATVSATVIPARTLTATPTPEPSAEPVYGAITFPGPGATVSGTLLVQGFADRPAFAKWQLDLVEEDGTEIFLAMGEEALPAVGRLGVWNTAHAANGQHMLRLRVVQSDGNYTEYFTHVLVDN